MSRMFSLFLVLFIVVALVACGGPAPAGTAEDQLQDANTYDGSNHNQLVQLIHQDPYTTLPLEEVSWERFFEGGVNVFHASVETLFSNDHDHHPHYNRLLHPSGVCFTGRWSVDQDAGFDGMFSAGAQGLVVARASTAFTNTRRGEDRAFALAVKIFPTLDPQQHTRTVNLFTFDAMMGAARNDFASATLTNEPDLGGPLPPGMFRTAWEVMRTTLQVDALGRRPLHPLAQLTSANPDTAKHPVQLELRPEHAVTASQEDFRDELMEHTRTAPLTYGIHVRGTLRADQSGLAVHPTGDFERIGTLVLENGVASEGCDHRIRFRHVKNH